MRSYVSPRILAGERTRKSLPDAARGRRPRPGGEPLSPVPIRAHVVEVLRFASAARVLAGGSRERLAVWQFYWPLYPSIGIDAMGRTLRWAIPGSRLPAIQSGRPPRWVPDTLVPITTGQSGSPPVLWDRTPFIFPPPSSTQSC